ncbi:MAG TPA: serine hydrolase [Solirubrobacteraceae bacterium]|nr:serine hydrolase [Solirubrobacteraceae bacterium]
MPAPVITRSTATPITLANWQFPEHTGWSYRHIRELIPTARIRRAASPTTLPTGARDHPDLPVRRLLDDDRTDGVLALHRGAIVLEEYRRGMRDEDVHLLQSVSKSITGVLAGVLVHSGALAPEDRICEHVPELAGSAFEGASVRDLLDMRAGTRFDETYADPDSDIRASEAQFGWAPGPRPASDSLTYLRTLSNHRSHGGRFEYRSILTDVLGLVLERAAGRPFAQALGDELWAPLGAETDAYVTVDAEGFAVADGGICVTLRDLARFGRMIADGGVVDGRRIVAAQWLDDTLAGGVDSREAFAADEHSVDMPGGHYRNQWWVPAGGHVLLALGIHGQFLFVDRASETVIAVVSTWPTSLDPDRHQRAVHAFRETARVLSAGA